VKNRDKHLCLIFFLTILAAVQIQSPHAGAQTLEMTIATSKQEYNQRDRVVISGSLRYNFQPVSDVLVALQVDDPRGNPLVYRALPTGGTPILDSGIEIQSVTPIDRDTAVPKTFFKTGTWSAFNVTIKNNGPQSVAAFATLTMFDGNMAPLVSLPTGVSLFPRSSTSWYPSWRIDTLWAYIGPAKAVVNVFSDVPSSGGVPLSLEAAASFGIVRGDISPSSVPPPPQEPSPQPGTFNTTFRFGPDPLPSSYTVYASALKSGLPALRNTTFTVKSSRLDVPSPPQASFTFTPLKAYVNTSVRFDASASSPENYNDTIINYEWNWGDGTPKSLTTSSSIFHKFTNTGTYNVTLKVTDRDSWGVTTKPVTVSPPSQPTADFWWSPNPSIVNNITTFNASISQMGWNGTSSVPIISYQWDFGDGNVTAVTAPLVNHTYTTSLEYNTTLTVTDSGGMQDNQTYVVTVVNPVSNQTLIGDVNKDGKVDGKDIAIAARAYGTRIGQPGYVLDADINIDGKIDGKDIAIIARHYGERLITSLAQSSTYSSTTVFTVSSVTSTVSPPQASFAFFPLKKYAQTPVAFDASASSPENFDGTIINYEWNWGDGSPKNLTTVASMSHKFPSTGTYNVTLKVTDNNSWAVTIKPITIGPPDPPVADFEWTPYTPMVNRTARFDATLSQPGWNGTSSVPIISYQWNFGDGNLTTVTVPVVYHTYTQNITYYANLTVTDSNGLQSSKTHNVTVANRLIGDINYDGKVDGKDIGLAAKAYGTRPGDPLWDPRADVNVDGKIDGKDIAIIARQFGQQM